LFLLRHHFFADKFSLAAAPNQVKQQ